MALRTISVNCAEHGGSAQCVELSSGLNLIESPDAETRSALRRIIVEAALGAACDTGWPAAQAAPPAMGHDGWMNWLGARDLAERWGLDSLGQRRAGFTASLVEAGSRLAARRPAWLAATWRTMMCVDMAEPATALEAIARHLALCGRRSFTPSNPTNLVTAYAEMQRDVGRLDAEFHRLAESVDVRPDSQAIELLRQQLAECHNESERLSAQIAAAREQHDLVQREIAALSVPTKSHEDEMMLLAYYKCLDTAELQLNRWRQLQADIHDRRIRVRDELATLKRLSTESVDHPYHDVHRLLLAMANEVANLRERAEAISRESVPVEQDLLRTTRHACESISHDLSKMGQQLADRYHHVRHHGVVAQLKALRELHEAVEEFAVRLSDERRALVDSIGQLDPLGADTIERAEPEFVAMARENGFLAARRHFVGQHVAGVAAGAALAREAESRTARLAQCRLQLAKVLEQLSTLDAQRRQIDRRRDELQQRLLEQVRHAPDGVWHRAWADVCQRLGGLVQRQRELADAWHAPVSHSEVPDGWLRSLWHSANDCLRQLSGQRVDSIWLSPDGAHLVVDHRDSGAIPADVLSAHDQQLVLLAMALATARNVPAGCDLPLVIDNFVPASQVPQIRSVERLVAEIVAGGQQVIVMSARSLAVLTWDGLRPSQVARFRLAGFDATARREPHWRSPTRPVRPAAQRSDVRSGAAELARRDWRLIRSDGVPIAPRNETLISVAESGVVEAIYVAPLAECGVQTLEQLLNVDVRRLDSMLVERGFRAAQLETWQRRAKFRLAIPQLAASHIKLVVDAGLDDPSELVSMSPVAIRERLERHSVSLNGEPRNQLPALDEITRWQQTMVDHWRLRRGPQAGPDQRDDWERRRRVSKVPSRTSEPVRPPTAFPSSTSGLPRGDYQFHVQMSDSPCAVPVISKRLAEQLAAAGIGTIRALLDNPTEEIVRRLANKRITVKAVREWQQLAEWMVRVPNLRAVDAQLLVAAGLTRPEQIVSMPAAQLLAKVTAIAESKAGQRLLRDSLPPDLTWVRDWLDCVAHRRALRAA